MRLLARYASFKTLKCYANGIFLSKLLYGSELWGSAPGYLKRKIQSLILEVAIICLGLKVTDRWSTGKLLKEMNWVTLENILKISSSRITHGIIHKNHPAVLSQKMKPKNQIISQETRLTGRYKLGSRPKDTGRTKITKYRFWSKAYEFWANIPSEIQSIPENHLFKKWLKKFIMDPKNLSPKKKLINTEELRI